MRLLVKLPTSVTCASAPPAPSELHVKEAQDYIVANGVKADVDALDFITESPAKIKKIEVEPGVMSIKVAVTQDAKDNKTPDFIVNLKEPVGCKEAPAAGFEYKLQPADELDATYDTYTAIPAAGGKQATAQIVLRDGFIQDAGRRQPAYHCFHAASPPLPPSRTNRPGVHTATFLGIRRAASMRLPFFFAQDPPAALEAGSTGKALCPIHPQSRGPHGQVLVRGVVLPRGCVGKTQRPLELFDRWFR